MAPRPRTYGTRRSYAKAASELVNGTTVDKHESKLGKIDVISATMRTSQGEDLGTSDGEENQSTPSQGLEKEDEPATGTQVVEPAALSHVPTVEDISIPVSPASSSPKESRMSAQDMSPPGKIMEEKGSRRKSTRKLANGLGSLRNRDNTTMNGSEPVSVDDTFPLRTEASSLPNGSINGQKSPIGRKIDLKDTPSDLDNLSIWVAQSISRLSDESPLSAISEPSQNDLNSHPEQDVEMIDALDNLEGVRMTRGKEKKRLQQLKGKGKEPVNEISRKLVAGVGGLMRPRDAARIERRLKDDLNDKLKQRLFGSPVINNSSAKVIECSACGKLLFNTLVDTGHSTNRNSAAALKAALNERKDDAPFQSAFQILASSSEIIAFVNFLFSKDDVPHWEVANADESRPSTGVESSGATTVTETSGATSRAGTSISDADSFSKITIGNKATDNRNTEKHKRSQEIVQALEAATTVLLQIQQGEVGTGYITPYFGGNIIPNPVGQPYIPPHGSAYGAPYPNHPLHGVPFGPPVGATFNNYASPYPNPVVVSHPNTYASPYSNSVNQHHANYASPYANSGAPNQATVNSPVRSSHNKADKPDGHEKIRDNKEAHAPHQDNVRVGIEVEKANDEIAGQGNSNKDEDTNKATGEADDQNVSNEKVEASRACDETTVPGVSNGKAEAHDVDMDANNVKGADEQDTINKEDEASNDDDLTDDDFMVAKGDNQNITPPAENHRLFTGERLGDFTSTENIDWLLTMSNGGKIPRPNKKARIDPPPRISPSQIDDQVQMEVSKIINQIMLCKYWRGHPGGTPKHLFYASAEGQQLAAELRRLMATAKPVVNTVVPLAESQARLRFYQHLESRAFREKRDHEIQGGFHRFYAPPVQMQRWAPAVGLPGAQYPTSGLLVPPILPSNAPMKVPFVPRGNVIAPPPGGRNIEEEKKAETYGYPPMPPQRPGHSQQGQKRKRTAKT